MVPSAMHILSQVGRKRRPGPGGTFPPIVPPSSLPSTPSYPSYDYSGDPGLASERANSLTALQGSQHSIDARRKQALLGFGSRSLARSTLGLGADDPFIQSIDENADTGTGTLARLAHAYRLRQTATDETMNKQNLYYSGHRGMALGELAYANEQQVAAQTRALQEGLQGLSDEGVAAQNAYATQNTAAEQAAMNRELDFSLQYPQAPSMDSTLAAVAAAAKRKRAAASTALTRYTK